MTEFAFPVRWPLFVFLAVISSLGLWIGYAGRREEKSKIRNLQDTAFRCPEVLTLVYSLIAIGRAIWIWIDPLGQFTVRFLEDPPVSAVMTAYCNGLVLTWVAVYVLFLWIRGHES
jgi:hypothetical protein